MKQKNSKPVKAKNSDSAQEQSNVLGLDADQSSVENSTHTHLNTDNDRVSSSPCGLDDYNNNEDVQHYSPLDEK